MFREAGQSHPHDKEARTLGAYAIEARSLGKRFGQKTALQDLNLAVQPGEIVGLVGVNGSGKSTALRLLAGLLRPSRGYVRLLGAPVEAALRRVGVVMEEPAFYEQVSPLDHIAFACACSGRRLSRSRQAEILESVGLRDFRQPVRHLSLGMRRRLALAVALSKDPAVLLLDEPTNGLDLEGTDLLRTLLRERADAGLACIFSSHQWDEVERLCGSVLLLHRGEVLYAGPRQAMQTGGALSDAYRAMVKGD